MRRRIRKIDVLSLRFTNGPPALCSGLYEHEIIEPILAAQWTLPEAALGFVITVVISF